MVTFTQLDIFIIIGFFVTVLFIGFYSGRNSDGTAEGYLLSGRKVGLFLFILTNVATWYGGILGVGEFTYRYGILSWVTQGLPYYVFAIIFAFLFAGKIRSASLFTIPDKIEEIYGRRVSAFSAVLIFLLVSPAPYLLMLGSLISLIFEINIFYGLLIGLAAAVVYLFKAGYSSDLATDAFEFFVMFIGFIIIVFLAISNFGGAEYLVENLPDSHLSLTGDASPTFIIIWFLIAMWTFTDPGFHQRCYAAKSASIAKWGIIISVAFWALFDFLTTTTGLFARASLPDISNPVLSFPLLAETVLGPGLKGVFYAAMFATILSTLNSFLFISGTTFGRDFIDRSVKNTDEKKLIFYTRIGLGAASVIAFLLAYFIQSVIDLWYSIGSLCIPGILLLVMSAYYEKFRIPKTIALIELISAVGASLIWMIIKENFYVGSLSVVEPMIFGLVIALVIHAYGITTFRLKTNSK
ncbi:MAG: sodium:solute symporter family protein [Melioribacteraceae bacterium]|nr:sodium:solute symporter family protein [Melioribacteraceae bacterium]MCF8355185.1 sodium:solute symporter family protein [Melioribacteraceae bacterium]MCF8395398.1 sodium:solute symporter family protein [Melioribacteraceae bacterium]MCF8419896.1 sodium:solute symporter family protein [Melioribacteraceae bacterium]